MNLIFLFTSGMSDIKLASMLPIFEGYDTCGKQSSTLGTGRCTEPVFLQHKTIPKTVCIV